MYKKIALIPAYEPEKTILFLVKELIGTGYECVVVNDGSGVEFEEIFEQLKDNTRVLEHEVNRGKGAALKTGMKYISEHYSAEDIVVTVDADGQHRVLDVEKVTAEATRSVPDIPQTLFLGSRSFTGRVPLRSRFGNTVTRLVYLLATGRKVNDTQTGLRAFAVGLIPELLGIDGDRYEYEMNVLMYWAKNHLPIREVEIETVYLNDNSSSHFDTLKDSVRIYWEILKFTGSSFVCFLVDYGLYAIFLAALQAFGATEGLILANVLARAGSATLNFNLNRGLVFQSRADWKKEAVKYGVLAAEILAANTLLLTLLTGVFGVPPLAAKIVVEAGLFLFSFAVQKKEIFADGEEKRGMKKFSGRWTVIYTTALLAFTLYAVLDTFVISSVYEVVDQEKLSTPKGTVVAHAKEHDQGEKTPAKKPSRKKRASDKEVTGESEAGKVSEDKVPETDKNTKPAKSTGAESEITMTEYREYDTAIYVAQIDTSSPVALRTAFAQGAYGRNVTEKTTQIAESVGAVLAINGDYYGAREKGYVIRNGVLYREEGKAGQEDLVIWQDGSFTIIDEGEITARELVEQGAWQVLSFGPALIEAGEVSVSTSDEVDKAMRENPRTAIGILENGDYVMVVSDGRTDESEGLSLYELAEFMQKLGVVTAYNLDGGGSTTMVYNGELVNNPTTTGRIRERAVSDIVYIAY